MQFSDLTRLTKRGIAMRGPCAQGSMAGQIPSPQFFSTVLFFRGQIASDAAFEGRRDKVALPHSHLVDLEHNASLPVSFVSCAVIRA